MTYTTKWYKVGLKYILGEELKLKKINFVKCFIVPTICLTILNGCSNKSSESIETNKEVALESTTTIEDTTEGNAFGVGSWGDSKKVIKEKENPKNLYSEENGGLIYSTSVDSVKGYVYYLFDDSYGLYSGGYQFINVGSNAAWYILNYNNFKDLLTKKYGVATSDEIKYTNGKSDTLDGDSALELGYSMYLASWNVEGKKIDLSMYSENKKIQIWIHYNDKSYNGKGNTGKASGI